MAIDRRTFLQVTTAALAAAGDAARGTLSFAKSLPQNLVDPAQGIEILSHLRAKMQAVGFGGGHFQGEALAGSSPDVLNTMREHTP
jgi:hypothetical protein